MGPKDALTGNRFDVVLFDLDGVLTATARVHASCWKRMFDEYLQQRAEATGEPFRPFDIGADYLAYVDGKPRYDGVRDFLHSRGIELSRGTPDDPAGKETICGLGNRKNDLVNAVIDSEGVDAFEGSVALVQQLRQRGIRTAVVTSSSNANVILEAAGIAHLFDTRVDGRVAARRNLHGKPAPDTFLEAARELGVEPAKAVVVEDAIAGVQAGRAGGFGLVIGVARHGDAEGLRTHGADLVVGDLGELVD